MPLPTVPLSVLCNLHLLLRVLNFELRWFWMFLVVLSYPPSIRNRQLKLLKLSQNNDRFNLNWRNRLNIKEKKNETIEKYEKSKFIHQVTVKICVYAKIPAVIIWSRLHYFQIQFEKRFFFQKHFDTRVYWIYRLTGILI